MIICDIGKHLDALSQHFDEYFTNDNIRILIGSAILLALKWVTWRPRAGRASRTFVWSNSENSVSREIFVSFLAERVYWIFAVVLKAVNILLPFATTYLCETAFSALTNMKMKYRSRLVVESDMRVCLSNITPRIDSLCKAKQAHPSH